MSGCPRRALPFCGLKALRTHSLLTGVTLRSCRFALKMLVLLTGWWVVPARATVGLAEWDVTTPGTTLICHGDIRPEVPVAR